MTDEVIEQIAQPALLVRLTDGAGKPTSGLVYALPRDIALALIQRRLAIPVGSMDSFADVVISDEELENAGLDWEAVHAMLTS